MPIVDATSVDGLKEFILRGALVGDPLRFRIGPTPQGSILPNATRPVRMPENVLPVRTLLAPTFTLDAYCPPCNQHSIFAARFEAQEIDAFVQQLTAGGSFNRFLVFGCTRTEGHQLIVALRLWSMLGLQRLVASHDMSISVIKIGMLPSLADLQEPFEKPVEKALGKQSAAEFKRAVGLFAHAIGIGAFVYLRRIFEKLIWDTAAKYFDSGAIAKDDFARLRMEEKIDYLKADLPPFLVENKKWYSIVSKGIHELSEEECKQYFPVVRKGIEIILDQRAAALKKEEDEREAAEAIAKIGLQIS